MRFAIRIVDHLVPDAFPRPQSGIFLLLVTLLLAACGGGAQSAVPPGAPIDASELPATLGRGFGQALLDGIDNQGSGLNPGDVAPNFIIQLEDGRYLTLADLQGRPVMINFWATWCGPCRLEMPDIVAAAEADTNLVVLAVNVQEPMSAIGPFVEEYNMSMPVVRDPQGALRDLYGVRGMPTSVFIHADGTIATTWAGLLTEATLAELLSRIRGA